MSGLVHGSFHMGIYLALQQISEAIIITAGYFMNMETEVPKTEKLAQRQTALSSGTLN